MKIVIAHYKYYVQGGPERYMFKFMELAKEHGCEVVPFSVNFLTNVDSKYSDYFVGKSDAGANFDANNKSLSYLFEGAYHEFHNHEAYKKMKKLLRDTKPDLIYVLIPGQLTADIFKAAKEEGVPVIHRISDFRLMCGKYTMLRGENICEECKQGNYKAMIQHRCIKGSRALSALRAISCAYTKRFNTYKYVDAIITPPAHTKKLLIESGIFPADKIHVNPTFIDCSSIIPSYTNEEYVLCLGRFSEEKGFRYVIEALQYLKDIPVKIAITGEKEKCDDELLHLIDQLAISDRIIFTGFLKGKELEDVIKKSLCVACPAVWYENMPNVVLEANAFGKPVIASSLGSLKDLVIEGENGLLFEAKNVKQIAESVRKLYTDEEFYLNLCKNARKNCEEKYSPEQHWQKFMDIYRKIK